MKTISAVLLALFAVTAIQAQSLEECRDLARQHYPETRQYDLIDKAEQYSLSNAAKSWIPQISLSGQATYQSATPTYPDIFQSMMSANGIDMTGIRKDQYKVAIDIVQNIWDGGVSRTNKEIAKAEATVQRHNADISLYNLQSRIDEIYFSILLLEERVRQIETMTSVLESNLERIRTYYKNGTATLSDVNAIEAEMLTMKQSLGQVKSARESYRSILELFIGKPLQEEPLEYPEIKEVASNTSARPELALLDTRDSQIQLQRKALDAALTPRVSVFAQSYYGYPGLDIFKSMMSPKWTWNTVAGLRISWNIGPLYTRENDLKKLDISQQQIAVQRDLFLFNSNIATKQQRDEIERLKKALEDDRRIVELRHSIRTAAESQLENGIIATTDLLRKIAEETTAELNRSTHEIELLQAIYQVTNPVNQ